MTDQHLSEPSTFFLRHEFAIRRLHSLAGIVPLGVYMVIHLLTNASTLDSPAMFQRLVYTIHGFGIMLPLIEWTFIFVPLLFHGLLGLWMVRNGTRNTDRYPLSGNRRYVWQRWTGVIVLVFLLTHVFHLHGWFHFEVWLDHVARPLGMAQFRPYNAASTLARSMEGWFWPAFYLIGVLASVYHLANGLWTAGITWGLWISAEGQKRATKICTVLGVLLAILGTAAWWGAITTDAQVAEQVENQMYPANVRAGNVVPMEEKRTQPDPVVLEPLLMQETEQ